MPGRAIVVHSLDDARIALAAAAAVARPVRLFSAPAAAGYAGAGWFAQVTALASADFPQVQFEAVLDCGDGAGLVMAALREGLKTLRFTGPEAIAAKLSDMARASGARLIKSEIPALDLRSERDPIEAARAWLTSDGASLQ